MNHEQPYFKAVRVTQTMTHEQLRQIVADMRCALERVGGFENELIAIPAGGVRGYIIQLEEALAALDRERPGEKPPVDYMEYALNLCRARGNVMGNKAIIKETYEVYDATPPPPRDAGREADARDAARYRELATPEIHDFLKAVEREALHQRDRWGAEHDAGKTDADWFWLIGYLAGKAINKPEKLLHHVITTAAACLNWHAARVGAHTAMRPGIADPEAVRALAGGGT